MARKVQVILEDDIDGGPADETVAFALDGVTYEIDLSTANAQRLRDALAMYVASGRRTARGRTTTQRRGGTDSSTAQIRAWARAEGIPVNERGRIPAEIRARYEAAHA